MSEISERALEKASLEGEVLPVGRGLLRPIGDGDLGKCVWEPYLKMMEPEPGGVTLGLDTSTEHLCRVSAYLHAPNQPLVEARRLCACWNAFIGVPLEDIEHLARQRSGWEPPSYDEMWHDPDAPATRVVTETTTDPSHVQARARLTPPPAADASSGAAPTRPRE